MFYEERVINGALYWRNNPDEEFTQYTAAQLTRNLQVEKKKVQAVDEISCRRYEEILELRAQLARCVELILNSSPVIWAREGRLEEAGAWTNQAIKLIEDADLKRAKADTEVLRCAESVYERHKRLGIHDESYDCPLCNAVRAAKELV